MPQVRITAGPEAGKVFIINRETLTIGRDPKCHVYLNDKGASRTHSEIFRVGEMCLIRDLNSRNGTYVNDERIEEELLRDDDIIQIGSTSMVFESDDPPSKKKAKITYESDREYRSTLELRLDDLFVETDSTRGGPYFRAMAQAAQVLQEAGDTQEAMEKTLDLIMEVIPADNTYVFLRDPNTGAISPRAWTERSTGSGIPVSRTILKKVIASGTSIMSSDAMADERFNAGESIMINKIKAVLCVPLGTQGDVFGAIYAVNQSEIETFEEEDLEILTGLGSMLAIALSSKEVVHRKSEQLLTIILGLLTTATPEHLGIGNHVRRVSQYAVAIAEEMKLPPEVCETARLAGILHDIDQLIKKTSETPDKAWNQFLDIISKNPLTADAADALRNKDECFDGTGTPNGLAGETIPIVSRILAVARGLDHYLFEKGEHTMSMKDAQRHLDSDAGKTYDPDVVRNTLLAFRHGTLGGQRRGVARQRK